MPPLYVTVHTDCDLVQTSSVFAGLIGLANQGRIHLRFRLPLSSFTHYDGRFAVLLKVNREGLNQHNPKLVCIDIHDDNGYIAKERLNQCHYYYKRNYLPAKVKEFAGSEKIFPLGPDFSCRNLPDRALSLRLFGSTLTEINQMRVGRTKDLPVLAKIKFSIYQPKERIKRYRSLLPIDQYEQGEIYNSEEPVVYFNTRCFTEINASIQKLNIFRARLIRKLKEALGNQFIGGFIPSNFVLEHYPDCVTTSPTDLASHIQTVKSSPICIYTNGLSDSIARKLAEYMAAARCIVAERFANELAFPLEDKKDIFYFETVDECVDICKDLLCNPHKIVKAQQGIAKYYRNYIHPTKYVNRVIQYGID